MHKRLRVGVIGFGRMGRGFVSAMQASREWDIVALCDSDSGTRELACRTVPGARVSADPRDVLNDPTIEVAGLFTLADARPSQIRAALRQGKHIIAEKPLAPDSATEWRLVEEIEASDRLVAVNIFNRNAWYHKELRAFISEGEIGRLAIIRICHMTPGHMPGEGHEPEGPPFHDCGMHYVDVARWYAASEYATWHAQGLRMWNHKSPWWVQVHGTFANGVVFDITQGFVYGHLAREKTHNCYVDLIGTQGVCRMRHDFQNATIECHGVNCTSHNTRPFNDKKLDVMCDLFLRSVRAGKDLGLPSPRDSAIASETAWKMLADAIKNNPPSVGTQREMKLIVRHRRTLRGGYGLPVRPQDAPALPLAPGEPPVACGEEFCGPSRDGRAFRGLPGACREEPC